MLTPSRPVRFLARVVRVALVGALPSLALPLSGCGGSAGHGAEDASRQLADADAKLRGGWTLVDFRPSVVLEPMLAQLLSLQMGRLTAQFDGSQLLVSGVGVRATRTYRVTNATMHDFAMTLYDQAGVAYQVQGLFEGDTLRFESRTSPWVGQGVLQRSR